MIQIPLSDKFDSQLAEMFFSDPLPSLWFYARRNSLSDLRRMLRMNSIEMLQACYIGGNLPSSPLPRFGYHDNKCLP